MCPAAGTRIIYDRKFLLDRRNSPIAQTPPAHLPVIPGVTSQNVLRENQKNEANNHDGKPANGMSNNMGSVSILCNNKLGFFIVAFTAPSVATSENIFTPQFLCSIS